MTPNQYTFRYRVRNWSDYNRALIARGRLTFWFDEDAVAGREMLGNSTTSASGKIGRVGGSMSAPGSGSDGVDCAQTGPGRHSTPTIPMAHASRLIWHCQVNASQAETAPRYR